MVSERIRGVIQKAAWFIAMSLFVGGIISLNVAIALRFPEDTYVIILTILSSTFLIVLYVYGAILYDRIQKNIQDIANTTESLSDTLSEFTEEVEDEKEKP